MSGANGLQAGDRIILSDGSRVVAVDEFQRFQTRGWWMERGEIPSGRFLPAGVKTMWEREAGERKFYSNELLLCPEGETDEEFEDDFDDEEPTEALADAPRAQGKDSGAAPQPGPRGLPKDDASRKGLPIFRGPLMYFPDALLAVAAVCKAGNDQHNPGEPLHWAREKSTEQMDTALRHMMDHGLGVQKDTDNTWHLAKAAWRILAELQLAIERERNGEQGQ